MNILIDPAWFWTLLGLGLVAVGPSLTCGERPSRQPFPLAHPVVLAGALIGAGIAGLGAVVLYRVYPGELLWASALSGAVLGAVASGCALW
ncbi:MAG: hypothetical protein ACYCWW_10430 [Deltaproteobacteria bacterium]